MKQLLLLACLLLVGCGSEPPPTPPESPTGTNSSKEMAHQKLSESLAPLTNPELEGEPKIGASRVISSSAELRLETESPEAVHTQTIAYAYAHEGYVVASGKDRTTIRIPVSSFHTALIELELLGRLLEKKIRADEVTSRYFDLQTRLANALKTRDRYLALLNRAKSIPEVLRVETELERINRQIESYKGQLSQMGQLTLLSSVTVNTREKARPGPIGWLLTSAAKGVGWLF